MLRTQPHCTTAADVPHSATPSEIIQHSVAILPARKILTALCDCRKGALRLAPYDRVSVSEAELLHVLACQHVSLELLCTKDRGRRPPLRAATCPLRSWKPAWLSWLPHLLSAFSASSWQLQHPGGISLVTVEPGETRSVPCTPRSFCLSSPGRASRKQASFMAAARASVSLLAATMAATADWGSSTVILA